MAGKALEITELTDEFISIRLKRGPLRPSKSSKSILVATTAGIKATTAELPDGRQIQVNCTAFVVNEE
jgi:hypothetical protein